MSIRRPNIRQRRLATALRRLRENAGMTGEQVGAVLEVSPSTISLLEAGKRIVRSPDLFALLNAYGVTDENDRDRMLTLSQDARRHDWFSDYGTILSDSFRDYLALEPEAAFIRTYEPQCVPGLLETRDYALGALAIGEPADLDMLVKIRLERQKVLQGESPPNLWAIIDESALLRPVGGLGVLREQLQHLVRMAELRHVVIQLLPFESVMIVNAPFTILGLPDPGGMDAVFLENLAGSTFLEEPTEIRSYGVLFERLQAVAFTPEESIERIGQAAEELGAHD